MIKSKDRAGWFGASDTSKIMGKWDTETFTAFWLEKLGLAKKTFTTSAMAAGTAKEHQILNALGIDKRDRQIRKRKYRLRVNLDGEKRECIYEVKTYSATAFKVSKAYWYQAQVEMFAAGKPLKIAAYKMTEDDYRNFFLPVDMERLTLVPVEYDAAWIETEYLPRLRRLTDCLKKGVFPRED